MKLAVYASSFHDGKGKGFAIEGNQLVSTLISDIAKATSEAK